jgi:hypothetical protein
MKKLLLIGTIVLLTATSASAQSSGSGMGFFSGGGSGAEDWCRVYNCKAYLASLPARIRERCAKGDPVLHDMGSCVTLARKTKRVSR